MAFFIGIIALVQIAAGVLTFIVAKSAIHEILGSVSFGMGVLAFALTVIIVKLDDIRPARKTQRSLLGRGRPSPKSRQPLIGSRSERSAGVDIR